MGMSAVSSATNTRFQSYCSEFEERAT